MKQLPLDYTRCNGIDCSLRSQCLRYLDKPEKVFLSIAGTLLDVQLSGCNYFIPTGDPLTDE
jgi:hypothetical protein